jgi:hypothetical protein
MKKLTRQQIGAAAEQNGLEAAALRAVIAVESGGSGYITDGRVKILFERHVMWKQLRIRGMNPRPLAKALPGLCGSAWDPDIFPYGRGGTNQYARIQQILDWASVYDQEHWESYKKAAYEACSWGLFQMMGYHYAACGYENVYTLKHAFEESEANQLAAILTWMGGNRLLTKLQNKQWRAFVRSYNGNGQVDHYTEKLLAAYEREKSISA